MDVKILDDDECCVVDNESEYLFWEKCSAGNGADLCKLVEQDRVFVRSNLLNMLSHFSKVSLGKQGTIEELFSFSSHFSFWWMTSIAEKSPHLSDNFVSCAKAMVLSKKLDLISPQKIYLKTNDAVLYRFLREYCRGRDEIDFKAYLKPKKTLLKGNMKGLLWVLPHSVQAILSFARRLFYFLLARTFVGHDIPKISAETIICSYFPNFDEKQYENKTFISKYWGNIPSALPLKMKSLNWLFFYARNNKYSFFESLKIVRNMRNSDEFSGGYFLLDEFNTIGALRAALRTYYRHRKIKKLVPSLRGLMIDPSNGADYSMFFEELWKSSTVGFRAMENSLLSEIYCNLSEQIENAKQMLYPWENQSWEKLLLTVFRSKSKSIRFLGYQSTMPKYFDLRMFEHSAEYQSSCFVGKYLSDKLLVGGPEPLRMMIASGYPKHLIEEVEMVRYMGMRDAIRNQSVASLRRIRSYRLLVATGNIFEESVRLIELLSEASRLGGLTSYSSVAIRSHPDTPIEAVVSSKKFNVPVEVDVLTLDKSLKISRAVVCANSTFVPIEAIARGVPAISVGCNPGFNLSPCLMCLENPIFIDSPQQLVEFLTDPFLQKFKRKSIHLDPKLTKMRRAFKL